MSDNKTDDLLPASPVKGLIPTLNNTGWMTESLDEVSQSFVAYAASVHTEVLDIGCDTVSQPSPLWIKARVSVPVI